MPLTLTKPFIADDKLYPYVAVQLIISPDIQPDNIYARTVVNFLPFRIDPVTGIEARPHGEMPPLLLADAYSTAAADPHLAVALTTIQEALQQYITVKGL